mgnify:CR=1 FL=1
MKNDKLYTLGFTGELILSNYILSLATLLDEATFKGGTANGILGKLVFIGFSIFLLLAVLGQINDSIANKLSNTQLYKYFFISRLFLLWIIMEVYLMSIEITIKYIPFKIFWVIYFIFCIQLFIYQKKMILDLQV